MHLPTDEGLLPIDEHGHKVAYWSWGEGDETLLGLHGGPGLDHRYLTRLSELGGNFRVVLYDQLGGGRSDRPSDDSLWTTERFVSEVEAVRERLGLGRVHLFGQSWGGWLALEYVLRHPSNVKSLVLSNTSSAIPETFKEMVRLRTELPADIFATLVRHEAAEDFDHPDYQAAVHQLYARHLRRATPFEIDRSLAELEELVLPLLDDVGDAYGVMWGPHEFLCNGSLLTWDVTERLAEIDQPTLILCGYYDELTVEMHRRMSERIRDNEFVIFGNASHLTILEKEADAYLAVIRDFVHRHSGTDEEVASP
jgi:proline iminopeptidase